ncbi:hypothetical protein C8F04DRAFT_1265931 [Mycena alexandri]|uniref:F-box domain-containing protein n=1 Tax=Mycena alexandri TaxID=1745969 RepID=A0AAD6SI15_9AGAR|nr:hypothetical protein C8F04DRAFT_1265931 [Mycena alexandri]
MSLCITEFPQDVLLELANKLDVGDLVNFLSTCRVIREIQFQTILWLNALAQIRAARQTARLLKNFKLESSRPSLIRSFFVEHHLEILCIPGNSLVVTSTRGSVSCWDIATSQREAHLELADLHVRTKAPCMEIEGKALIGAFIGRSSLSMKKHVFFCVDFCDLPVFRATNNDYIRRGQGEALADQLQVL